MNNEQTLKVLLDAGAKLLRFRRIPNPKAPHVEAKNPEGFGDWHRIAHGGPGATLADCLTWLNDGIAEVERAGERVTIHLGEGEQAGIGLLPASLDKLVVDIDLASKRALASMPAPERQRRSIAGHDAVVAKLGKPDGVQRSPSGGLHCYYPATGIPKEVTDNATWAIEDAKVGGDLRGSNGWVGIYDLGALAKMVEAGHGPALDVGKLRAFVNNPHRDVGMREYRHVRAGGGSLVQAACAAIRSAEAGDTYAGRNPTIVHHVAVLAKEKLLDDAAAKAVLDAVGEVKPEAIADTERFIGKARRYFADSTGNTGGPAGVRGADREGDTGDVSGEPDGGNGEIPPGAGDDAPDDALVALLAQWQEWKGEAAKFKPSSLGQLKREAPALLAGIMRQVLGRDAGEHDDTAATLDAMQAAIARGEGAEGIRQVAEDRGLLTKPRAAVSVPNVEGERPAALLSLAGHSGAVVSLGTVGVLSGEGGMGKSALTASLALALATRGTGEGGPLAGGLFNAPIGGGPVLLATYEDAPAVTRWRIEAAAKALPGIDAGATRDVYLMDMAGAPLYGPRPGGEDRPGLYNARPEPLAGWRDLWGAVKAINPAPRLVVIDPVLSAFAGNSNEAAPVREFLSALAVAAGEHQCAVLLVAHSTKAARQGDRGRQPDPFDPGKVGGSAAWTDGVRSALILDWDDARGPGERRLAVAKSNYGPARVLMPLEPVKVGGDDAANKGAVVAFKVAGPWDAGGAGDVDRSLDALVAGIKALRKAHPKADLARLQRAVGSPKGRNRQANDDWNDAEL